MIGDGDGILRKHGYACLSMCVCATTLATWKQGHVCDRVFFLGQISFLFSGNARILFKTTAMERFFYSILASLSLILGISKQDDSVHSISLLIGGHRSGRIPSTAGGEEVQC